MTIVYKITQEKSQNPLKQNIKHILPTGNNNFDGDFKDKSGY
jgi:hypothetical protein